MQKEASPLQIFQSISMQDYVIFMEKITHKLAETFRDLNQLCLGQLAQIAKSKDKSQVSLQQVDVLAMNPIEVDSPEVAKQTKTKKIKKEENLEKDHKDGEPQSKKKAKKVSHKPKAPASSFLLFFKAQQPSISLGYPTYGVTELTKVAAKCWGELSSQQKQPYIKLCDQQRRIYQQKMQKYRIQFPQQIAEKEKDRRQSKKDKKNLPKDTPRKERVDNLDNQNNLEAQEINDTDAQRVLLSESQSPSNQKQEELDMDSLGVV